MPGELVLGERPEVVEAGEDREVRQSKSVLGKVGHQRSVADAGDVAGDVRRKAQQRRGTSLRGIRPAGCGITHGGTIAGRHCVVV